MAKAKTVYVCQECGWESPKWMGQCRTCSAWGTLEEQVGIAAGGSANAAGPSALTEPKRPAQKARPVTQIDGTQANAFPSGLGELDRVLGKGITPGAVILFAGEPGVGKSTLLLEVAARYARMAKAREQGQVLYVTGEESASQVRLRAERIDALTDNLLLAAENDLQTVLGHIEANSPSLIIVDSVQTVTASGIEGAAGGVNQVKAVTSSLIRAAKSKAVPVILVGHVTKEGSLAGPRTLEHLVDVVCQFEGDRQTPLRLLRSTKNRYGATDEVGCFQLTDRGIEEVPDPSELFMSPYREDTSGSAITVSIDGNRPVSLEIQALVTPGGGGSGRRTVVGVDAGRTGMILAVLQARLGVDSRDKDIYVSTVGGARTTEPATDFAIAMAILSAYQDKPLPPKTIAIGEIGLTAEIRGTASTQRRINEAARLGFQTALIPAVRAEELQAPAGLNLIPIRHLGQAARQVFG